MGRFASEELREQLEVGELVVRRQHRVRLGRALGLGDLHHRLVAQALGGVVGGHRRAREVDQREHLAVADVRVVGNRQRLDAAGALRVQEVPEVFRVVGIEPREREGQVVGTREDHVAVQVALARADRPLVGGERGELARRVVPDRGRDDVRPHRAPEVRGRIGPRLPATEVLGVVGHREEVERGPELDLDAAHVRDGLALGVAVGVVRRARRAEYRGVVRVARVQVQVAEVDVLRHGRALGGDPRREQDHRPQPRDHSLHGSGPPGVAQGLA